MDSDRVRNLRTEGSLSRKSINLMYKVDNRDNCSYCGHVSRARGERHVRPRGARLVGSCVVVLLALQALVVYQLVLRAHGPPNFRRGGAFYAVGTNGRPVPYAPAGANDDPNATTTTV